MKLYIQITKVRRTHYRESYNKFMNVIQSKTTVILTVLQTSIGNKLIQINKDSNYNASIQQVQCYVFTRNYCSVGH